MISLPIPKKTFLIIISLVIIIIFLALMVLLSFSTTSQPPQPTVLPSPSSSPLDRGDSGVLEKQQETKQNLFPLIDFLPYQTKDFEITYSGPLTLEATLFNKNTEVVKQQILLWIKSKEVDPSSHLINFKVQL